MSEDFSDDFLVEEGGSSSGPFLITVSVLIIILLLGIAGTAAYATRNRDTQNATRVAIEATNEAISTQNAFVTQTLEARATEAARPSETPQPTATTPPTEPPPTATITPEPTDTPVVVVDLLATPTPDFSGAGNVGGSGGAGTGGGGVVTPTPITGIAGAGTLPTTGIGVWSAIGFAFMALFVLLAARRLRSGV